MLRDVTDPDLRVSLSRLQLPAPVGLAPTGFTRLIHPAGECAVARAAAARGAAVLPVDRGTVTIEELAGTGHRDLWFQLYVLRDRDLARRS